MIVLPISLNTTIEASDPTSKEILQALFTDENIEKNLGIIFKIEENIKREDQNCNKKGYYYLFLLVLVDKITEGKNKKVNETLNAIIKDENRIEELGRRGHLKEI